MYLDNNNIEDPVDFVNDSSPSIIKVVGVGGGGCNAVNYMYHQDIPGVTFAVCNTDMMSLRMSPVPTKLVMGYELTHGNGAGNKPEVGRECAEASAEELRKLFTDQTEMVFITAGMGGGTGTGAAPVVARIAKEAGMLTIGIVTVPFLFEGDKKIFKALEGAEEMRKHVDALLVINNENLIEIYSDLNFFNAFGKADDTLANAARSISEIITEPCYINVDFQDVRTTLLNSGTAIISTAYGEGEHRLSEAIHNALHSPLLKKHDIETSQRVLFKFSCSKDSANPLKAEEMNEITQFMAKLPKTVEVKWGISDNPELGDKVKITVLASGFDVTLHSNKEGTIRWDPDPDNPSKRKESVSTEATKSKIEEVYGKENLSKKIRQTAKVKYAILRPEHFDNDELIAQLERTPAYNRDPKFNDMFKPGERPAQQPQPRPESRQETGSSSGAAPITF